MINDSYPEPTWSLPGTVDSVAIHEAGHYVVGRALGLEVSGIDIVRDPEGAHGAVRFTRKSIESAPVIDDAAATLAGAIAENIKWPLWAGSWPRSSYYTIASRTPSDREQLVQLADKLTDEEFGDAHAKARRILLENWAQVEALARELISKSASFPPNPT